MVLLMMMQYGQKSFSHRVFKYPGKNSWLFRSARL